MADKSLYFQRSETKTVLRFPESFSGYSFRMLTIRTQRRTINIVLTLLDKEDATDVPVATYRTMEDAVADMDEVNRILSGEGEPNRTLSGEDVADLIGQSIK